MWIYGANFARFNQAYQDIAEKLNIPGQNDPKINVLKLVADWLNDRSHGPWLMIVDNADIRSLYFPTIDADTSVHRNTKNCLVNYLPLSSTKHGSLIITTRNKNLGMDLADGRDPIDVMPFSPEDAEKLLKSKILESYWDKSVAEDLLRVLGYIPLAITQAAAFMRQNRMSLQKYLSALNQSDSNLAGHLIFEL